MKAAVVTATGKTPIYSDFEMPVAKEGEELVAVRASALSHFSKSRSTGSHYSSSGVFPAVAGVDGVGVTQDGRRVYFVLPDAPFGALAEFCPIKSRRCVELPDSLEDITAAAIANPGMSAWAALVERARLMSGETVLVNGATSTAGRLAVQLAKYLGAAKVIATGRNAEELDELKQIGADIVIPFNLAQSTGAEAYEHAVREAVASGIDVVIDYLWGASAEILIAAIARTMEEAEPVRFVHVGAAGGAGEITLPGAALRSSAIALMGSGVGSVQTSALLKAIRSVFDAVQPASLRIATTAVPLADVEKVWNDAAGKPRLVFTIG